MRVDGHATVLVAVSFRHEVSVGSGDQHGARTEHERVNDLRGNLHLPAVLGEDVPCDVAEVAHGGGEQDATTLSVELLVEVVVVVPQGNLVAGDLDPRSTEVDHGRVHLVDDLLCDGATVVRVDMGHTGEVEKAGGQNDDTHALSFGL